jgi:hypothetical protein
MLRFSKASAHPLSLHFFHDLYAYSNIKISVTGSDATSATHVVWPVVCSRLCVPFSRLGFPFLGFSLLGLSHFDGA